MIAYYIPAQRFAFGPTDAVAFLVATWLRMGAEASRYDGVSLFGARVRVCVGCSGAGTGWVFDEYPAVLP